jgi:methyltransferase family protein/C-methyltransferase-like protein
LNNTCPNCGTPNMEFFYKVDYVPVHSVLLMPTKDEAINYTKGNIHLYLCKKCGFISNMAFESAKQEYSSRYEETQGFSPTFNKFHKALAARLIEKHNLRGKKIIEIGCGKGDFITMLCEQGNNTGYGFDPAYIEERNTSKSKDKIKFITDLYSEKYTDYHGDFVCCKMTLEHIHSTFDFVKTVRKSIGDRFDTMVFFQIPNGKWVFEGLGFWDIYYEHCSYFSTGSLNTLFSMCGFDVLEVSTEYDDQYLAIEAMPSKNPIGKSIDALNDSAHMVKLVEEFTSSIKKRLDNWNAQLNAWMSNNQKVVLWGGGSKGVAFLTTLNITDQIKYAVDINPYKQGTFLAGTGQEIVSPEFLKDYNPDVVIIMNPIYTKEISEDLNKMGLDPIILSIEESFQKSEGK